MSENNNIAQTGHYQKTMGPLGVASLALGAIIGWGAYVMAGTTFLPAAGPSAMIGIVLGGIGICFISKSYLYCMHKLPRSGGEFLYAGTMFGKSIGYICGWFLVIGCWAPIPLCGTAIALLTRYLIPGVFQVGHLYTIVGWDVYAGEVLLSWFFIIGICFMNTRSVKMAGWFQNVMAAILAGAVIVCTVGVLVKDPDFSNLQPFFGAVENGQLVQNGALGGIIVVFCTSPFLYVGFDTIPMVTEEHNFSIDKTKRIMYGSILLGAFIYCALIFITAIVEPWSDMIASDPDWATGAMVLEKLGYVGLIFLGASMMGAILTGINGFYIASSRLLQKMASVDAMPSFFGRLNPKYNSPDRALWFMCGTAVLAPLFGRPVLGWIVDANCVGAGVAYGFTCVAAVVIARRDNEPKDMFWYYLGILVSALFVFLLIIPGSPAFLCTQSLVILALWMVLGAVFYISVRKKYIYGPWKDMNVLEIMEYKDAQELKAAE